MKPKMDVILKEDVTFFFCSVLRFGDGRWFPGYKTSPTALSLPFSPPQLSLSLPFDLGV